ncbi:MAG: Flp pilus assembly protein CpaB [Acidimicrobiales bacterium]
MVNRRTLIAASALALGLVAAMVALVTVNHARSKANATVTATAVFVVAKTVPAGTTGDAAIAAGLVKSDSIPRKYFPPTAITNLNSIKGKIAPSQLSPGQIIVDNQFVQPDATSVSSSGIVIPTGQVAITISLDPVHSVAGLIVPGDRIDLMSVFSPKPAAGSPAAPETTYAHFFYQNAEVLAIGTTLAPSAGATKVVANPGSSLYTLAVPAEAAERIVLAAASGNLYAALVPPNNKAGSIPAVNAATIDGPQPPAYAQPPTLTPYGK